MSESDKKETTDSLNETDNVNVSFNDNPREPRMKGPMSDLMNLFTNSMRANRGQNEQEDKEDNGSESETSERDSEECEYWRTLSFLAESHRNLSKAFLRMLDN